MESSPPAIPTSSAGETEVQMQEAPATSENATAEGVASSSVVPTREKHEDTQATKPNGETNAAATEEPQKASDHSPPEPEDTEMLDSSMNVTAVDTPQQSAPPANGTPASTKRANTGGSSKKKGGVPEHKSKKLQRKKSRPLTNLEANPGEYYFARMKGHAPWPSIICDETMLPTSLLNSRPVTARLPDGTFKRPEYADGGKRVHERTFPVMFLHTNEFAWMPNTELTPLDPADDAIKSPAEKGKSKTLLAAYAKAAEGNELVHFKNMLADHQKALADDQAEKEERAAAKKAKKSRKSQDVVADDDEMDVDDEDGAPKSKTKKRKKAEDSDGEEKPAKTPKTATKLKLSEPKTPADSATKKKATKPKATAAKSSSDEDAASKTKEVPMSAEEVLQVKERKVLYFRHKLQRSMLNRDSMPKEEEMGSMSEFLGELETYPDLEASIIRKTKIHKVLKNILKLGSIPLEAEHHFKDRSRELLNKWNEILQNDPSGGAAEGGDDKADDKGDHDAAKPEPASAPTPVTNGATPATEKKSEPEATSVGAPAAAAAAKEAEPETKLENRIGTTIEGEKEAEKPKAEDKAEAPEKTAEEKATDGPAVDSQPAAEYKPLTPTADETVAASES